MQQPIRIAGGGLSGLATAVLLARRGLEVEVFDRHPGGGGRFHGGWQVLENGTGEEDALDELGRFGLDPGFEIVPATTAVFLDGFGNRHEVGSDRPYAYFVRRGGGEGSLDGWLRGCAAVAGVAIRDAASAPDRVEVIATGPRQADGIARELVFATDLPDTLAVLFDPEVVPTGYAYLFSLSGHATFGVAQVRHTDRLAEARALAWEAFRRQFGEFAVRREHDGGQFMNFALPSHLRDPGGRWHVGEAAGVQDFLFGLGNRLALRSAAMVADGVAGRWEAPRFQRSVVGPMRTTVALRWMYEQLGQAGLARFCRLASRTDFRSFLVRLQRPRTVTTLLARIVMPLWRERRGCRHGPLCTWCRRSER